MNIATKKWILLKISSLILIPLMLWFVLNLVSIYDKSFDEVLSFFSNSTSKLLFSSFIVFAFFFSALSISEVFEDYISEDNFKNVANRLLYLSAIIIPLITIILLLKLN
jgi:succinate dehydrogenase / fumarate reductase, membrane anchor subunit